MAETRTRSIRRYRWIHMVGSKVMTRTRTIGVGGRNRSLQVTAEASVGYELLLTLASYLQPDIHTTFEERPLGTDRSSELSPGFQNAVAKVGGHSGRAWLELLPLVRDPTLCH